MVKLLTVILGISILALITASSTYFREKCTKDYDIGVFIGVTITLLVAFEITLVVNIFGKPKPSVLDVYRGKTELEITSVNGIPIDTVVVFKKNNNYGTQNKSRNK